MTKTSTGGSWKRHRVALVDAIVGLQLGMHLDGVYLDATGFTRDKTSVDVWVSNHTSRYDGFLVWRAKHTLDPSGRLFTVMLAESIGKHPVFNGAGAVGLAPGSTSSVRSVIRFIENVPKEGDGLVLFPQGKIYAGDKVPVGFRSITRLAQRTGPPARFIPCAIAVEMLDRKRPTAFLRLGDAISVSGREGPRRIENAVEGVVRSLRDDLARHGESLPAVWQHLRPDSDACIRLD